MESFVDRLDQPVYVVTVAAEGERAGCLVSFASQCSIRPARFMVWLSTLNRTFRVARSAERLAVHLLGHDQYALAELFGGETGDHVDKFARVAWTPGPGGVPVLDGTPSWFVGRVEGRTDTGDHVGFLLSPVTGRSGGRTNQGHTARGHTGPGHTGQGHTGPGQEPLRLSDVAGITAGHPVA